MSKTMWERDVEARLRALRDAPTRSLPRSSGEIRRTARRRQQRNRMAAAGSAAAIAVIAVIAVLAPWRPAAPPAPPNTPAVSSAPTAAQAAPSPRPMPWNDAAYHPAIVEQISTAGGQLRVTLANATFTPVSGQDTFFLRRQPGGQTRTLALAPDAHVYVSRTWSGLCGSAGVTCDRATDFTELAPQGLAAYVRPGDTTTTEFWYVLDSAGRIALLYQVYHP